MDAEFQRVLTRVVIFGGVVGVVGASILVIALRSFGVAKSRGGEMRAILLISVLLVFVIAACVILLRISAVR